jgi:molybdate transport system ATP-binding protein
MFKFSAVKEYPNFKLDVSISTEDGLVTGLFGQSGSGKTSIINIAAGLVKPDSGDIAVNGRTLFNDKQKINVPVKHRKAGYIFQDGRLFPHMTVLKNLKYGMVKNAETKFDFDEVINLLGIETLLDRRPHRLSGGEKQRVAIGRALLSSPDFLLMDEPLSALDKARKEELIPFISKTVDKFKIPVIYVTHSIDELLALCDNVVLMENGKCNDFGSVEEVVSKPQNMDILGLSNPVKVLNVLAGAEDSSQIMLSDGRIVMPTSKYPEGTPMRAVVNSADVSIAIRKPEGISTRNIMQGVVTSIKGVPDGRMCVTVDVGRDIYATVTRAAINELKIKEGLMVYAMFKSTSVGLI